MAWKAVQFKKQEKTSLHISMSLHPMRSGIYTCES